MNKIVLRNKTVFMKKHIIVSLAIFYFLSGFAQQNNHDTNGVDTTGFSKKYYHHKNQFELLPNRKKEIVFLGNSITARGNWSEWFNNKRIINRGISGDRTDGVLYRLDEVISSKPKKIFLLIGVNDIKYKMGIAESTLLDVMAFSNLFRLRNVKFSAKDIAGLEYVDSNTVYGKLIDRNASVTIINLHASIQPFFGHFSSGVAEVLQANYISNEVYSTLSFLEDQQLNLITNPAYSQPQNTHPSLSVLQQDIQQVVRKGQYCVLLVNAIKDDTLFQLNTGAAIGNSIQGPFFKDAEPLNKVHKAMLEVAKKHEMNVLTHEKFGIPDKDHVSWWIHQNTSCNLILLHVNVGVLKKKLYDYYQYMVDVAQCLAQLEDQSIE